MTWLRALGDLLRNPFSHANREALGFALMFYGGVSVWPSFSRSVFGSWSDDGRGPLGFALREAAIRAVAARNPD